MGRTVYAEEGLLDYLISLAKPSGYTIGLILGQSTAQKDFVVHLARTPPPAKDVIEEALISSKTNILEDSIDTYIKSFEDIPESWVADHAKHVTRMLPGGTWVLGIFTVGPDDTFISNVCVQKLRSVLSAIHKNLGVNQYLHGNNNQENLLLNFNSITQKYVCKSLETNGGGILKPADWKFQKRVTKWHQLEALVDLDQLFPIPRNKTPQSLKKQLQDILKTTSDLVNSALVVIEGESRCSDDTIEAIGKQKKDKKDSKESDSESEERMLQVGLYIPCQKNFSPETKIISCSASMRLVGQLVSRTFVHQKATIEEATNAVKQDVMRSLASRLEMHWDSLIEEEDGSPEETVTLHEPPRRVLVELPRNRVTLSDYLFPGEGAQEALLSLRELLDVQVQESTVQKDLELQVDPAEFYCQNVNSTTADSRKEESESRRFLIYITSLSVAILILVVAVLVNQLFKQEKKAR
ncbi:protein odr-4 homolog [Belonocnema kinseyi]|uniref:protein odr-4 homolog n=1 Tax=Belonocnema kinseyi TaxID=2817044 RepID=UPI00143D4255|nr:protein odr-4 homolog [Belonocnema kinseyi]